VKLSVNMTRTDREEINRKLAQTRRLALEPSDPLTRERLAQLIEDLKFQLIEQRQVA
jgi:hypothetical protein